MKRASLGGALFIFTACLSAQPECHLADPKDWQTVKSVHDGDSLLLKDNRKIRIIGVNTPELAIDNRPEETFATEARDFVRQLIDNSGARVGLVYGENSKDKYGRTLAHVFLPDGRNISRLLLEEGLGSLVAITPNIRLADCYHNAQLSARKHQRKLWGVPGTVVTLSTDKKYPLSGGFRHVRGSVTRVSHGGKATWLQLGKSLTVKIRDSDRGNFPFPLKSLDGRVIEVSGWIYPVKKRYRMNIHHPATLNVIH